MKEIFDLLKTIFEKNKIAGLSVGVTDKEKTLSVYNFGFDDIIDKSRLVDDRSLFRIASISKIVTGLCVMRLVGQGKLDLSAPIGNYVGWLKTPFAELTINSLLSHTAGLPKEYTPDGTRDESLLEQSLIDELGRLDATKIGNGKPYLYSNVGIRLASLIVEKVEGELFSQVAKRLILEPLQMNETTYYLQDALDGKLTKPHAVIDEKLTPVPHWENAVRYGAGGLISTTKDVCKLARLLLNYGVNDKGERVVSQELIKDMFNPICDKGDGDFYGKTIMLHYLDGRYVAGHLGSAPPYFANLVVDDKTGKGVVVLYNTNDDGKLRYQITDAVLRALDE